MLYVENYQSAIQENGFNTQKAGHIVFSSTTAPAPTIAVTTQAGITAVALVAGSADQAGSFTTTGTSTGGTVITLTFGTPFATAPRAVDISPINATAAGANTLPYVSSVTTTTFVITIPTGGTYGATPSYSYQVLA
jgi:hypothetical protein